MQRRISKAGFIFILWMGLRFLYFLYARIEYKLFFMMFISFMVVYNLAYNTVVLSVHMYFG